jgi:hypothetical protein
MHFNQSSIQTTNIQIYLEKKDRTKLQKKIHNPKHIKTDIQTEPPTSDEKFKWLSGEQNET